MKRELYGRTDILHECKNCMNCKWYKIEKLCGYSAYCYCMDNYKLFKEENGETYFEINKGPDDLNGYNQCKYKNLELDVHDKI
jgi:hypothetical protein